MAEIKKQLCQMLNQALELEQAARIQYLSHAELIAGETSEKIVERIKEIAADEKEHEDKFRNLIGGYLGGKPTMGLAQTHEANQKKEILEINLKNEKEAIDFYKQIHQKIIDNKDQLTYEFETLEHELRHVIIDEQEHVVELAQLLGK
jgi:bacterioferritin (cytochrome b1)